ncbi:hypothetical protein [Streptomyces sp. PRh5]|nr:hypothetical protein [Streptomyces sp. PRh5]
MTVTFPNTVARIRDRPRSIRVRSTPSASTTCGNRSSVSARNRR